MWRKVHVHRCWLKRVWMVWRTSCRVQFASSFDTQCHTMFCRSVIHIKRLNSTTAVFPYSSVLSFTWMLWQNLVRLKRQSGCFKGLRTCWNHIDKHNFHGLSCIIVYAFCLQHARSSHLSERTFFQPHFHFYIKHSLFTTVFLWECFVSLVGEGCHTKGQ